jgi:hypothetical protein
MREGRFAAWMPLFLALTSAVAGWLMFGPLAQSTLIVAALVRRLRSTVSTALGRTDDPE